MRKYLASGHFHNGDQYVPMSDFVYVEDDSAFDDAIVLFAEKAVLQSYLESAFGSACEVPAGLRFCVSHIQLLSSAFTQPHGPSAPEDVQLNTCEKIMPPVDSPLLIEVAPGVLLRAIRMVHVEPRSAPMVFELDAGGQYTGRPRWTHP